MATKPALGKGLASLLPGLPSEGAATAGGLQINAMSHAAAMGDAAISNKDRHPGISLAQLDEIQASPYQPRREFDPEAIQELAQSIRSNGLIQPLVVRRTASGYELIAGERRMRAAKEAGLKQVPIVIRRSTDREALELALIENIQRRDLNCVETALAYFQLTQDFSLTQEEIAERVGKDRASVANHMRLLRLPEEILEDLKKDRLSFGHGKVLLGLEDPLLKLKAREEILSKGLSVRDAEALVETMKANQEGAAVSAEPAPAVLGNPVKERLRHLAKELTHQWSTRVEVKGGNEKGKIVLHYHSRQDLDRILEQLQGQRK